MYLFEVRIVLFSVTQQIHVENSANAGFMLPDPDFHSSPGLQRKIEKSIGSVFLSRWSFFFSAR